MNNYILKTIDYSPHTPQVTGQSVGTPGYWTGSLQYVFVSVAATSHPGSISSHTSDGKWTLWIKLINNFYYQYIIVRNTSNLKTGL